MLFRSVAFTMGVALARSITGAVHELITGTDRVRHGDFSHRISVESRDQLGELADSFNAMTASIEVLLREKAEKERLEQELRVARQIQMSLLPQGPLGFRNPDWPSRKISSAPVSFQQVTMAFSSSPETKSFRVESNTNPYLPPCSQPVWPV